MRRTEDFGADLAGWAKQEVGKHIDHDDVDDSCRSLVRALGEAGWLKAVVPAAYGGLSEARRTNVVPGA